MLPQRNDVVAHRIPFWGVVWSFAGLDEEGAVGVLAKLVTEHAKTPRSIAKPLGDLRRGQSLNKIRPECLVGRWVESVGSRKTRLSSVSGLPVLVNI